MLIVMLVMLGVFFALLSSASYFINRQFKETLFQEQEEQAFHVAEAGVHYVLFLLSSGAQTPQSLLEAGSITQSVHDQTTGAKTGKYVLAFSPLGSPVESGQGVAVESTGWDVSNRRCQIINARVALGAGSGAFGISSWDHAVACSKDVPPEPGPQPLQSAGPQLPGAVIQDDGQGTYTGEDWIGVGNAATKDGQPASSFLPGDERTEYLLADQFNFNLPSAASVAGIQVTVSRLRSGISPLLADDRVRIVKNGLIGTTERAETTTNWPTSYQTQQYGGGSDTWGEEWTASAINSPDFGVAFSARNNEEPGADSNTAEVDYIEATIFYNLP